MLKGLREREIQGARAGEHPERLEGAMGATQTEVSGSLSEASAPFLKGSPSATGLDLPRG